MPDLEMDDEVKPEEVGEETPPEPEDRGDELPEDEPEQEPEPSAENKEEDKQDRVIPKSRFDEVNNERKELKARIEQLEALVSAKSSQPEPEPEVAPFDLDAAEEEYATAVVEGDTDRAKQIRKEIRKAEEAALLDRVKRETERDMAVKTVAERKAAIISQAFQDYPVLDHNAAEYDANMVAKINRMSLAYQAEGKAEDQAIALAIADIMPAKRSEPESPRTDNDAKRRNAKAAESQPPSLGGVGTGDRARAASLNVNNMTEDEFAALPEREKKRLRGD